MVSGKSDRLCSIESSYEDAVDTELRKIDGIDRIFAWRSLKELLQPEHKYFEDKQACIKGFLAYKRTEQARALLYPVVCGKPGKRLPRGNPYRKHQLARSNTARRIKMMLHLIKTFKLNDFKMAFITFSFPKEISIWLSNQKNGIDMAWRLREKLWKWYDTRFGLGLAASTNLHTWETECLWSLIFIFMS